MRSNIHRNPTGATPVGPRLSLVLAAVVPLACAAIPPGPPGPDDYLQTNLVSDQPGVALLQDTDLVNAWGIAFSPTSPFWISDNGSGLATIYAVTYDAHGTVQVAKQGLQVTIPGDGTPSGQAFNSTPAFHGDIFLFSSEDGTISGWRGALGSAAEVLVPANDTNVYKGLTLASNGPAVVLLAANFRNGTVDEYDGDLTLIGQFTDPNTPAGYAPFNVLTLDGMTFVTYAKQDADKHDDVAGKGNGFIDVINVQTGMFHRLATGKDASGKPGKGSGGKPGKGPDDKLEEINSPWGMAIAPSAFGRHANQLLVGNFGSGTIMAFEPDGRFDGLLGGPGKKAVVIDGLWGLAFGNGARAGRPETLYFTAGPNGEGDGLFGAIDPRPKDKGKGPK